MLEETKNLKMDEWQLDSSSTYNQILNKFVDFFLMNGGNTIETLKTYTINISNFIAIKGGLGPTQTKLISDFMGNVGIEFANSFLTTLEGVFDTAYDFNVNDFKNYCYAESTDRNTKDNKYHTIFNGFFYGMIDQEKKYAFNLIDNKPFELAELENFIAIHLRDPPKITKDDFDIFIAKPMWGSILLRHDILQELFLLVAEPISPDGVSYTRLLLYDKHGISIKIDVNKGLKLSKLTPVASGNIVDPTINNLPAIGSSIVLTDFDWDAFFMEGVYTTKLSLNRLVRNKIKAFAYVFRRSYLGNIAGKNIYTFLFYGQTLLNTDNKLHRQITNRYTPYAPYPIDKLDILSYISRNNLDTLGEYKYEKLENTFLLPNSMFATIPQDFDIPLQDYEMQFLYVESSQGQSDQTHIMRFKQTDKIKKNILDAVAYMFYLLFDFLNAEIISNKRDTNFLFSSQNKGRKKLKRDLFTIIFSFIDVEKWASLRKIKLVVPLIHSLIRIVTLENGVDPPVDLNVYNDFNKAPIKILCPRIAMSLQDDAPCLEAMFAQIQ